MKMLEYCQRILAKVSFDRHLFAKELAKSIKRLETADIFRVSANGAWSTSDSVIRTSS